MRKLNIHNPISLTGLITLVLLLVFGCDSPVQPEAEAPYPLTDIQFNYLDLSSELYFAVTVAERFEGAALDTVGLAWCGTATTAANADTVYLNDDGSGGDILARDGVFSAKVPNSSATLNHPISTADSGLVYLTFFAWYAGTTVSVSDSFHLGNLPPVINWADVDTSTDYVAICSTCQDTDFVITRPNVDLALILVRSEILDPNGLNDVNWVGFTSFHVGPDTAMNNGNVIYLYDDGGSNVIYPPSLTSRDEIENDGIYSFAIPIYSGSQTKTGLFRWSFQAGDLAGNRSEILILKVAVQ